MFKNAMEMPAKIKSINKLSRNLFTAIVWRLAAWPINWFAVNSCMRLKISGRENLKALPCGPIIVASNHSHNLDPFVIVRGIPWPSLLIPLSFMVKEPMYKLFGGLSGLILPVLGCLKVHSKIGRKNGVSEDILAARKVLENGLPLGMFPEGRISPDGKLGVFSNSIGRLVVETKATVLPVAIVGMHGARWLDVFLRKRCVHVSIGEPLMFPKGEIPAECTSLRLRKCVTKAIRNKIEAMIQRVNSFFNY